MYDWQQSALSLGLADDRRSGLAPLPRLTIGGVPSILLSAYRRTAYRVAGIVVRIGQRCPAMDHLLTGHRVREAVFITAHNPFSHRMPRGWNDRMQVRLAAALVRRTVMSASGGWRRWSEAHFFVFGDWRPTLRMARRFRQNGIVIVRLRQPASLLLAS
jgi:hypothetical protein